MATTPPLFDESLIDHLVEKLQNPEGSPEIAAAVTTRSLIWMPPFVQVISDVWHVEVELQPYIRSSMQACSC